MVWATVSSWSCFCWLYRASPSLATKNIINVYICVNVHICVYVYISSPHIASQGNESVCLLHIMSGRSREMAFQGLGQSLPIVPRIHSSYILFRKRIPRLWARHKAAQVVTFPSIPWSPGWTWDKFRPAGCEWKGGEQSQGHVLLKGDYSLSTAFSFLPFLPEGWNEDPVVVTQQWVVLV